MSKLELIKDWRRDSDSNANLGHYVWSIESENGWIALTPEQNEALQKLEDGFFGNPMINDDAPKEDD